MAKNFTLDNLMNINKMLYDNFILLLLFFILTIIFLLILTYFVIELTNTIISFYKHRKRKENIISIDDDNENYNQSGTYDDPSMYIGKNKRNYMDKIEASSANYNKEKSQWIKKEWGDNQDLDKINDNILYKKHDNYTYEKKI